jgi:hypothetical protein
VKRAADGEYPQRRYVPLDIEQDVVLNCRTGGTYDIHYSMTPLSTLDGQNIGSVLVIQDVTESRKMLRQLSYSASHDALTHLAKPGQFRKPP